MISGRDKQEDRELQNWCSGEENICKETIQDQGKNHFRVKEKTSFEDIIVTQVWELYLFPLVKLDKLKIHRLLNKVILPDPTLKKNRWQT